MKLFDPSTLPAWGMAAVIALAILWFVTEWDAQRRSCATLGLLAISFVASVIVTGAAVIVIVSSKAITSDNPLITLAGGFLSIFAALVVGICSSLLVLYLANRGVGKGGKSR